MSRPTLIDLNPVELKYYPFMIGLGKYNGICNDVDDLSTKICVPSKTTDINVQVFNIITRINEAKTLMKQISCNYKCKFNSTTCDSNWKWNNDKCQCECTWKNIIVQILAHIFVRIVGIQIVFMMIL